MIGNTLTTPFLVSKCCFQTSHAAWEATGTCHHMSGLHDVQNGNKNMGPKTFLQVPCIMYFQGEEVKDDKVKKARIYRRAILFSQV